MDEGGALTRKFANAAARAARNPAWLREAVRGKLRARADLQREFRLADHSDHLCTVAEALESAFGVDSERYAELRSRVKVPSGYGDSWQGGADILALIGALVLLRRPRIVIETGVATGYSTAVALAAMRDNGTGHLHSIDLPPLQVDAASFIGSAVDESLRDRWTLHVGPSRLLLPRLLKENAPVDIFIHDSDHSYAGQWEEYERAWPYVAVDGCLISDDVGNDAFTDFAAHVGARPYLMSPPGHNAAVGLLVKSS